MVVAVGLLLLLVIPFRFFDVIAVTIAAWTLWWMWTAPAATIRDGAGLFPWAPIAFASAAVVVGGLVAQTLGRLGFWVAVVLLGVAVGVGALRGLTPSDPPAR